jgi:DnaK suppressor protein
MASDVEKYRKMLIKERDELTKDIGTVADVVQRIPSDSDNDMIEVAQHGPVIDVESSIVDMKSSRLEKINAALDSVDAGTYGICEECGKPIDERRLDAEPTATMHVECQSAGEASFVTPTM